MDSSAGAKLPMTGRLDSIILYNLSGTTINVAFAETSLTVPLAASASLNLDTWDLAATVIYTVTFTAASTVSVNCLWIEGEGIGYTWLKMLRGGRHP